MTKQFQFDDENIDVITEETEEQKSHTQPFVFDDEAEEESVISDEQHPLQLEEENDGEVKDMANTKTKKKFVWLWWHYVLLGLAALFIAFFMYIFIVSRNDGPVYGDSRCEGLAVAIEESTMNSIEEEMKNAYNTISDIDLAIECKQLKVDIYFNEKMNTKKAKEIATDAVTRLDAKVGLAKEDGKKFSSLFGVHNNVNQYEINFYLYSDNNDDFPIFGTKHVQNDEISFTLHSVKDKTSADKAQATLND